MENTGTNKDFSIGEAYRFGWQTTKANFGFVLGFMIVGWILQSVPNYASEVVKDSTLLSILFMIISWVISMIVGIGFVKTGLRFCNDEKGEFSDLYAHWNLFWPFLGMTLLNALAVMGGFLLLIVPGIILAIRLQFGPYLVVDKGAGPLESLKQSFALTKGFTVKLLLFGLVGFLINLAGMLCLFVGLLVSIPVTWLAAVYVYKKFV